MEIFFKKYFWTVNLGVLTLGSFLAAKTINTVVGDRLRALPQMSIKGPSVSRNHFTRKYKNPKSVLSRNIFNSQGPAVEKLSEVTIAEQVTADEEKDTFDPNAPIEETDLDVQLVAVVMANLKEWSFAQIRERRSRKVALYKIGDTVLDEAKIYNIQRAQVIFKRKTRYEKLTLWEKRKRRRSSSRYSRRSSRHSTGRQRVNPRNIKKVGRDEYVIAEEEVKNQLGNLNYLATQARIVPHFVNGKGAGFKLYSIRPGSLYSMIGIRNGDVIQQINGNMINSPDKALEAYSTLKSARRISIDVLRRGRRKTLTYNIGN